MQRVIKNISLCALVMILTGCGDGWQAVRTDKVFPYGNQRTAGSAVMYVRANLLPQKELKVEAQTRSDDRAEKIFTDSLNKVSSAPIRSRNTVEEAEDVTDESAAIEDSSEDIEAEEEAAAEIEDMGMEKQVRESVSRSTVFISEKEIIAPKRDFLTPAERGQITLDEIYNGVYDNVRHL